VVLPIFKGALHHLICLLANKENRRLTKTYGRQLYLACENDYQVRQNGKIQQTVFLSLNKNEIILFRLKTYRSLQLIFYQSFNSNVVPSFLWHCRL
jgi:hypothetical protein